jgi:hypothetical protein
MFPVVRHMLLCEVVRTRRSNPFKFDLLGVLSTLRPVGEFPLRLSFSVFLQSTGGRGSGLGSVRVIEADTDDVLYDGNEHTFIFDPDPTHIHAARIRIVSCTFEGPGLYWVDFMYNGEHLSREPLLVKEPS